MRREETKRDTAKVLPLVEEILKYVHERDERFLTQTMNVGSYHTHLKVKRADEFDFNVVVDVGKLSWGPGRTRYYGLNNTNDKVERKGIALPNPPTGKYFTEVGTLASKWDSQGMASMTFENDIIPIKVKRRFKALVGEAVNQPKFKDIVSLDRMSSSPATTFSVKFPGVRYPISIDLCPMIESKVEFKPEFHWPRLKSQWPVSDKVTSIKEVGVNEIAKDPFYWTSSFAACEKELLEGIDKTGTCRRKCLRIMKSLRENIWCRAEIKKGLTSYHLKNALFWECEDYPYDTEWQPELLETRVQSMTNRLLRYLQRGRLPLYFNDGVNLLSSKDPAVLKGVMDRIQAFLEQPETYLDV